MERNHAKLERLARIEQAEYSVNHMQASLYSSPNQHRKNDFSKTFMGGMYRDTGLNSDKQQQQRRIRSLLKMKAREEQKLVAIKAFQRKGELAKEFLQKYNITSNEKDIEKLSEYELTYKLNEKLLIKKQNDVCTRI